MTTNKQTMTHQTVKMNAIAKGEYGEIISRYFQRGFPKAMNVSKDNLLEILSDLLVGTKEYRYGPKPKVESLYTIRQTLIKAIELNAPIPVLVPWGGRKADHTLSVDVAEAAALKQLIGLDEVVKQFYPPGLHIHVRIEDLGASWIYRVANYDVEASIEKYSSDLSRLIHVLRGSTAMEPIRESKLMNRDEYFRLSEKYSELIEEVIRVKKAYKDIELSTIPEFVELQKLGWKGEIDKAQQEYYTERYKKLYPGRKEAEYDLMLSDYLGGAKARYDLNGRGEPDSAVGSYIQITFVPPIPGAPKGMFSNTLYYRTVPESSGRTHIAPWRGKGYLELIDDYPVAKVTYSSRDIADLVESEVHLTEDGDDNPLILRADYRVSMIPVMMPYIM
jgi:hypothetical protein